MVYRLAKDILRLLQEKSNLCFKMIIQIFIGMKRKSKVPILFIIIPIQFYSFLFADKISDREYQIKSAYLYNFTKFIEWPDNAFQENDSNFIIGVYNDPEFVSILQTLNGKFTKGKKIHVIQIETLQELPIVHLLYFATSHKQDLNKILKSFQDQAVLTVGEDDIFLTSGGIINLQKRKNRMQFAINNEAAVQSNIKISSKLLGLATNSKSW